MHVRREARLTDDHRCGVELSLAPTPVKSSQKNRPDAPYEGLPPNRWMQPTLNAPDRRVGVPPAGDWRPKLGCALAEVRRDRKWVQAVGCHGRCFKHGSRKGRLGHRNLGPSLGHPMAEDRADKLRLGWMPRIDRVVGDLLIRSGGRYPSSPAGRHAATSRRSMVGLVDHDRLDIKSRETDQAAHRWCLGSRRVHRGAGYRFPTWEGWGAQCDAGLRVLPHRAAGSALRGDGWPRSQLGPPPLCVPAI